MLNKKRKNKKGQIQFLIIFIVLIVFGFFFFSSCSRQTGQLNTLIGGIEFVEVGGDCVDDIQCQIETENDNAKCVESICNIPLSKEKPVRLETK